MGMPYTYLDIEVGITRNARTLEINVEREVEMLGCDLMRVGKRRFIGQHA
jgi:hypothetical protein